MNDPILTPYCDFHGDWALVAAGNMDDHNAMTVSWGGIGCLWNKPVATVYVRPNRHTYGYFEANDYFTVSFYPGEYKKALGLMGTKSGRDCDKEAEAGLTPIPCGESVTFAQAGKTLLCRKLYHQDMELDRFPENVKTRFFGSEPAHRMYIGEIIEIV